MISKDLKQSSRGNQQVNVSIHLRLTIREAEYAHGVLSLKKALRGGGELFLYHTNYLNSGGMLSLAAFHFIVKNMQSWSVSTDRILATS